MLIKKLIFVTIKSNLDIQEQLNDYENRIKFISINIIVDLQE